jgi:hypothetical protein
MRDHLRFAVVYWHTFRGTGSDPFGAGTMQRPWDDGSNSVANAQNRARVAFEFIEKARRALLLLARPRRGAGRKKPGRVEQEFRRRGESFEGRTETHRHQIAVGNGQFIFQSAFCPRREHELQR